jgi:hypothetical protein
MLSTLRVLDNLPEIDGTIKYGVKYVNWSKKDFYVNHIEPAIHLK